MGTLWKIALRNTIRHGRRTIITAVVMMVGISIFISFDSMLAGLDRMAVDNMADYTVSSLKSAHRPTSRTSRPRRWTRACRSRSDTRRGGAQGLTGAPRVRFVARVSNYTDEIPVLADAVDPAADTRVFRLAQAVTAGSWLPGAAPPLGGAGRATCARAEGGVETRSSSPRRRSTT